MKNILFFLFIGSFHVFAQQVNVTFNVDMTYQSVSDLGVHLAGSFQGWDPSLTQMNDDNEDNIYSVTLVLDQNSTYEYKFINGNSWGSDEQVLGECGTVNGNRTITVDDSDFSETAYYFGSCDYAGNEVCNYASVDYLGLVSTNEFEGVLYLDFESYSPAGTSIDGYTTHIIVNSDSSSITYNYPVGNNNSWYTAISVVPGGVYSWSATIETCGGGQTINGVYISPILGCTDSLALNYDSLATSDNGLCAYQVYGCTDSLAVNYNDQATDDDGSCEYTVYGCIDESACNYDSSANTDDQTCEYAAEGYDCAGNEVCNYASVDYLGLVSTNEFEGVLYLDFESYSPAGTSIDGYTTHIIVNSDSSSITYNYPVGNNNSWYTAISVVPGGVYSWSATIETCGGGQTINGAYISPILGCTDSLALNYDSLAINGCAYISYR